MTQTDHQASEGEGQEHYVRPHGSTPASERDSHDSSVPSAAEVRGWEEALPRLRSRLDSLRAKVAHTSLADEVEMLRIDVLRLSEHFEQLFQAARGILELHESQTSQDSQQIEMTDGEMWPDLNPSEVAEESVVIQREQHQTSQNALEVIKAMLMWRDDPEERVRERH